MARIVAMRPADVGGEMGEIRWGNVMSVAPEWCRGALGERAQGDYERTGNVPQRLTAEAVGTKVRVVDQNGAVTLHDRYAPPPPQATTQQEIEAERREGERPPHEQGPHWPTDINWELERSRVAVQEAERFARRVDVMEGKIKAMRYRRQAELGWTEEEIAQYHQEADRQKRERERETVQLGGDDWDDGSLWSNPTTNDAIQRAWVDRRGENADAIYYLNSIDRELHGRASRSAWAWGPQFVPPSGGLLYSAGQLLLGVGKALLFLGWGRWWCWGRWR